MRGGGFHGSPATRCTGDRRPRKAHASPVHPPKDGCHSASSNPACVYLCDGLLGGIPVAGARGALSGGLPAPYRCTKPLPKPADMRAELRPPAVHVGGHHTATLRPDPEPALGPLPAPRDARVAQARPDDFGRSTESLPQTHPRLEYRLREAASSFSPISRHKEREHPGCASRAARQADRRVRRPLHSHGVVRPPDGLGPRQAWRCISGLEPGTPTVGLGWKSMGVLELTALPSLEPELAGSCWSERRTSCSSREGTPQRTCATGSGRPASLTSCRRWTRRKDRWA